MENYIGEIRLFAGTYAPMGWVFCDGRLLPISQYDALYSLLGTTYGGDGVNNFGIPDLRSRIPIHRGTDPATGITYNLGVPGGVETVALNVDQMPAHAHVAAAQSTTGVQQGPEGGLWAASSWQQYTATAPNTPMASSVAVAGGSQPHSNLMPFGVCNYIIALEGIYPTQD